MNRIVKDIEMDDIFVKSYMKGLQNSTDESKLSKFYGGSENVKSYTLFFGLIGLLFALYIAYTGPKLNDFVLLFIRFMTFMMIVTTIISLLLYVRTGKNVANNQRKAVMNILGIETSHFEKILQDIIMIVATVLILIIAIKGNKADKMVFHLYGVTAIVQFVNALYLLYF